MHNEEAGSRSSEYSFYYQQCQNRFELLIQSLIEGVENGSEDIKLSGMIFPHHTDHRIDKCDYK